MWGTACAPSTSTGTPWACAVAIICFTGLTLPSALETWVTPTMRVRALNSAAYASRQSSPASVIGTTRIVAPVSAASICHATDSPGISAPKHGLTKLGGGPGLMHGASTHPLVVQRLMEVAEKEGIPLQHEASTGFSGTDTDQIFDTRSGIPSALVSLPMRYMHSTVEMVDTADLDAVVRLLTAFVHALTPADTFKISI